MHHMHTVTFKIDKKHLAHQLWLKYLTELSNAPEAWKQLYVDLKEKYGKDVAFTFFDLQYVGWSLDLTTMNVDGSVSIKNIALVDQIFEEIFNSSVYIQAYTETQDYKKQLEKEWSLDGDTALSQLKDISRLPIGDREIDVYVIHPDLDNGSYISGNRIEWGYAEIYPNSNVVGICHEILHVYTQSQASNLMHALIFLAAQEELRCRINNLHEYFNNNGVKTYHDHIIDEQKRLLGVWNEYLDNNEHTLIDLYDDLSSK